MSGCGCCTPDGDPLTYSLASRSENATVEQTGPATFGYTSTPTFRGVDGLLVLARDGRGGSTLVSARIEVDDPAPLCTAPAPLALRPLRRGEVTVDCRDPDGGPVRLTAITRGVSFARAAVDGDRVTVLATTAGAGRLRVAATDDDGSVATFEFDVRVTPYPAPRSLAPVCFDGCALGADGVVALGFRCGRRAGARELPRAGDGDGRSPPARVGDAAGGGGERSTCCSCGSRRAPAASSRRIRAAALTLRASVRGSDGRTRGLARSVPRPR